jgi:hypothetical protein
MRRQAAQAEAEAGHKSIAIDGDGGNTAAKPSG